MKSERIIHSTWNQPTAHRGGIIHHSQLRQHQEEKHVPIKLLAQTIKVIRLILPMNLPAL